MVKAFLSSALSVAVCHVSMHARSLVRRGFPLLVSFGNSKVAKLRFTKPVLTESALGRPRCPVIWDCFSLGIFLDPLIETPDLASFISWSGWKPFFFVEALHAHRGRFFGMVPALHSLCIHMALAFFRGHYMLS